MEDISLHILDIAENAINAGADRIAILIAKDSVNERLIIEITDNGKGMDEDTIKKCLDPFFTTQLKGFGLGLSLLYQAAEESGGKLNVFSEKGKGTKVSADFGLNHIDRKPLGDKASTITTLLVSNPDIEIRLEFKSENGNYEFDTIKWKELINPVPISDFNVLKLIKQEIKEGQKHFENE